TAHHLPTPKAHQVHRFVSRRCPKNPPCQYRLWHPAGHASSLASWASEYCRNSSDRCGRVPKNICFPQAHDTPPILLKSRCDCLIANDVSAYLVNPVRSIVPARETSQPLLKITTVPEVAVAEDRNPLTR